MKYLVTGGAGLSVEPDAALLASGQSVRVLDNFLTERGKTSPGWRRAMATRSS